MSIFGHAIGLHLCLNVIMRYLVLVLFVTSSLTLKASHIVGGDIYYDYLGNYNYRFYVTLYRDCASNGASFDDPLSLAVFVQGSTTPVQQLLVPFPGSVVLPLQFNNPCGTAPSGVCTEKAIYTIVVNLPPINGGYTITYQRCCRGPAITNLVSPDNTGLTLSTHIPGLETGFYANSSPRFKNFPPLLLCNNDQLIFDHSATDPDGDVLVYSLVTPLAGADAITPAPAPPPAPPYYPVTWSNGFSASSPLGLGSNTLINSNTGLLTSSPQTLGLFVVGIRVQEFRNGVLIGQTVRDFLFKVLNCNIILSANLPAQEELSSFVSYCQGLTVDFENNSFGGSTYKWDFGVDGITTDVSNQFTPSYTYPAPGTYNATLVVNPGQPCTDTANMIIKVNNEFTVYYETVDSICYEGNRFDFYAQTIGATAQTYNWNFGPNASVSSESTENVLGVTFNTSGFIPITIEANYEDCNASYTENIYIFPEPVAGIQLPNEYECQGLTIDFGNLSTGSLTYQWDFGVLTTNADTSSQPAPSYTFPEGGTYNVTLIGSSVGTCKDTTSASITVYELLSISFTHNDSLCITDNNVWFDGTMTGPSFTQYAWNFGPDATPAMSSDLDVNNVVFNSPGIHNITLTAWFNNCYKYESDQLFIFRAPSVDFSDLPGPRCIPATVQFENLSSADTPMYYTWSFGDGNNSKDENPIHIFENAGSYSIGLEVITTEGCVDTLYMLKQDFITVHPSPTSQFKVSPEVTNVCNDLIQFTDEAVGANQYFYWFDDSISFSMEQNPIHNYQSSGTIYPMQIAVNEYGCRDTSYQKLEIEPFSIYIPNSFTPDGDDFNNEFNGFFGLDVYEWELTIYNKWGELIYQTNDPQYGWDGSLHGVIMPQGIYAYRLKYVSCDKPAGWQMIIGHVNLLR